MSIVQLAESPMSGLDQLTAWINGGGQPPIGETLDFRLVEVEEGRAVFEGVPDLRVYNPNGMFHGGYAATLLDSACVCAVHSRLTAAQTYSTLELKIAYHRAITAQTGLVRADGRVLSLGRRAAFAEATLKTSSGRLLASATSTLLIMDR